MPVDLSKYHAWKEQALAEGRVEGEARGRCRVSSGRSDVRVVIACAVAEHVTREL